MKGTYKVSVENNRLHYEFEIKQKITIIRGDSATGKNNSCQYAAANAEVWSFERNRFNL